MVDSADCRGLSSAGGMRLLWLLPNASQIGGDRQGNPEIRPVTLLQARGFKEGSNLETSEVFINRAAGSSIGHFRYLIRGISSILDLLLRKACTRPS
jgi:hypothetical protein